MTLGCFFSAVVRLNDRFSRRAVAKRFTLLQKFPLCDRTQHKNRIHSLGSNLPLFSEISLFQYEGQLTGSRGKQFASAALPIVLAPQHRSLMG
jgi:hypothetical protein